jgi:hypothetical protein
MQKTTSIKASNLTYNPHQHSFHLIKPSPWPFLVAFSIGNILIHTVFYLNGYDYIIGPILHSLLVSFITFLYAIISWSWDILSEVSFKGRHSLRIQHGLCSLAVLSLAIPTGIFLYGAGPEDVRLLHILKEAYQSSAYYCTPEPWFWRLVHECLIRTGDVPLAIIECSKFLWDDSTFSYIMYQSELPANIVNAAKVAYQSIPYCIPEPWFWQMVHDYYIRTGDVPLVDIIECGKFLWGDSRFSYIMYQGDLPADIVNAAKMAYQSIAYCTPEPWFWQTVHHYYISTQDVPLFAIVKAALFLFDPVYAAKATLNDPIVVDIIKYLIFKR